MKFDILTPTIRAEEDMLLNDKRVKYLYAPEVRESSKPYKILQTAEERFIRKMSLVYVRAIITRAAIKASRRRHARAS